MAQGPWNTGTWEAALWDNLPTTSTSATGSPGSVGVSQTIALTGVSATGDVGSVVASSAISIALTGVSATGDVGSVSSAGSIALTGVQATGYAGTESDSVTISITGVSATGFAGSVGFSVTVSLTGVSATGAVGSVVASAELAVAFTGVEANGAVGTVSASAPPVIIIDDTHDGKRLKKQFDREREQKKRRKDKILEAYEIVFEGRPAVAEEIVKPFTRPATETSPVPTIDFEALLSNLDAVKTIMREMQDIDDEEALTLLW